MKKIAGFTLIIMFVVGACSTVQPRDIGLPAGMSNVPTSTPQVEIAEAAPTQTSSSALPQNVTWHIQYSGEIDYSLDVDVYNIDLFDVNAADIARLRARGIFVTCYFNAGAFEDWRPDAAQFPDKVLGKDMENWAGEQWLDIRDISALKPIISARLGLAVQKGCDGVDPDNINGYENDTGFPLSYNDQIAYNIWLADQAHARGLSIGLKNDLEQIADLQPFFDWALNEECFFYEDCHLLLPFNFAGKPIFVIEYEMNPEEFCPKANELGFNAVHKKWELDGYSFPCR